MSTYLKKDRFIGVINSEELYNFMHANYNLGETYYIPYSMNDSIKRNLKQTNKEKIILIYGRPSVKRNCFNIIIDALIQWQQKYPIISSDWRIVSVGEKYDLDYTKKIKNFMVAGKLSLKDYADLLSRASIGISLMLSPHPSYPPLEMASAGVITISNNYEFKDIEQRSEKIIGIDEITSSVLVEKIFIAVNKKENQEDDYLNDSSVKSISCSGSKFY